MRGAALLARIEFSRDTVLSALIEALKDTHYYVRREAAKSLEHFGSSAKAATAALQHCLTDTDEFVHLAAARALGTIDPRQEEAVHVLAQLSKGQRNPDLEAAAAEALRKIRGEHVAGR